MQGRRNSIANALELRLSYKCRSCIYTGPNCVITVPAVVVAPNDAGPSAGKELITKSYIYTPKFLCLSQWILKSLFFSDDFIQTEHLSWSPFYKDNKNTSVNENIEAPHYWSFLKGNHRGLIDSAHKGPVMWKAFQCQDVIPVSQSQAWPSWRRKRWPTWQVRACARWLPGRRRRRGQVLRQRPHSRPRLSRPPWSRGQRRWRVQSRCLWHSWWVRRWWSLCKTTHDDMAIIMLTGDSLNIKMPV